MGLYCKGDVLLALVALDNRSAAKARPVVVIGTPEPGRIRVCPVSSRPPFDAPCIPLAIDDFAAGGLDMFGESYVMTSRVITIRSADVIGKRGRLTPDSLAEIAGRAPETLAGDPGASKKNGRRRR
jgi:hypothetical protein